VSKKVTILETKLERIKADGYEDDEVRFITERIKVDDLVKERVTTKNSDANLNRSSIKSKIANEASKEIERKTMPANKKLLMLPGDGIGPEVMNQVQRVIGWMENARHVSFDIAEDLIGGACYEEHGCSITDKTMADALSVDAVLLGAVGGPKWDNVERHHRPEQSLLRLRKEMDLFANLRPAIVFPALAEASSLKTDLVTGLDLLIIRELTSGVYFGEPRGIEDLDNGEKRAVDTQVYTSSEIDRVCKLAFEMARKRQNRVTSVEKANVMETGVLWREIASKVHESGYNDVELSHMYADNCAMQLVRQPKQFDVIVTDNLFGDILSDCAAMLTGSLGMLPSASLGTPDKSGRRKAMYEPVHGTAPDIAGQNKANPLAMILSYAMCLRYSFDMAEDASLLETAVQNVLENGLRTGDIMQPGKHLVSCEQMGEAVITELKLMEQGFAL
jgi:3-isopropylmalate dehydrogenase